MRYKAKVLARFPDARLSVERREQWGEPNPAYVTVMAGQPTGSDEEGWDYSSVQRLDIHADDGRQRQLAAAAWRSAYFWCVRNPVPMPALAA